MHEERAAATSEPKQPLVLTQGSWEIATCGATYLIDVEAMHVVRIPRDADLRGISVAELRRDGETLALLAHPSVVVGEPLELMLLVREDGQGWTWRHTTPVVSVRELPASLSL